MCSKFECFVEISGQKYDIVLSDNSLTLISFTDIYPKIQQIVSIALNVNIDFSTHEFEVFENYSTEGSVIRVMNQIVRHKSVIRIKPKPKPVANPTEGLAFSIAQIYPTSQQMLLFTNPMTYPSAQPQPTPQTIVESQPQQAMSVLPNFIPLSHSTTNSIPKPSMRPKSNRLKVQKSSNVRKRNFHCKVCPILLDNRLNCDLLPYKTTLKVETYKRYRQLFKTVAEVCEKRYHSLTNNDWIEVIPNKMNRLGYSGFTSEEWKNCFISFLEKYSQVLRVSSSPEMACNLFPFFHVFNSFVFDSKQYFFKRIHEFKEKLRVNCTQKPLTSLAKSADKILKTGKNTKDFDTSLQKLIINEKNIKLFHSMVLQMNSGFNFKDNGDKYWKSLADKMCETDPKYRFIVTSEICKTRFYIWTRFYAQNYEKLNGKLEPKVQKVFDLLKIVHTLDLLNLFSAQSSTYKKIKEISLKTELRDYFNKYMNQIYAQKLMDKEIDTNKDNVCETTVLIERPKNVIRIGVKLPKSGTNICEMPQNSNHSITKKQVLSHKSVGNELNFIAISQTPDPRLRKGVGSAKQSIHNMHQKPTTEKVRPQIIETIVLD